MSENASKQELLKSRCGDLVLSVELDKVGCPVLWVEPSKIIQTLSFLRSHKDLSFDFLSDLTCYDDLGEKEEKQGRFVIVYNLRSLSQRDRLRVKVRIQDGQSIATAVPLWKAANWLEREVFDMYGVRFDGHPDLRRILMDQRFEGHPQRKDYYWRKYQLFLDAEPIPEQLLRD